jgi:hypothetical protein
MNRQQAAMVISWRQLFGVALTIISMPLSLRQAFAETSTFQSGESATTLIELFTSEGCSSCPPADKWLSKLKNNPDLWSRVVPVAFHVDYWNNLGWMDRFSRPEFTERQRGYGAAWGSESVYTPNFVVNGREWKGWFNGQTLPERPEKPGKLHITLTDGKEVSATFVPTGAPPASLKMEVAFLGSDLESDVKWGENGGRKLHHDFVVLQLAQTDMVNQANQWSGKVSLSTKAETNKPAALAAWIKSSETVAPIQATGGWLKP